MTKDLTTGKIMYYRGALCRKRRAGSSRDLQSDHDPDDFVFERTLHGSQHPDGDAIRCEGI